MKNQYIGENCLKRAQKRGGYIFEGVGLLIPQCTLCQSKDTADFKASRTKWQHTLLTRVT